LEALLRAIDELLAPPLYRQRLRVGYPNLGKVLSLFPGEAVKSVEYGDAEATLEVEGTQELLARALRLAEPAPPATKKGPTPARKK